MVMLRFPVSVVPLLRFPRKDHSRGHMGAPRLGSKVHLVCVPRPLSFATSFFDHAAHQTSTDAPGDLAQRFYQTCHRIFQICRQHVGCESFRSCYLMSNVHAACRILFQRSVYPEDDFHMVKKYGQTVLVTQDLALENYLEKCVLAHAQFGAATYNDQGFSHKCRVSAHIPRNETRRGE